MYPRLSRLMSNRVLAIFLMALMACAGRTHPQVAPAGESAPNDGLRTAAPDNFGLATAPLAAMTAALRAGEEYRNVHALLIAKEGQLVYEEYFAGEDVHRGQRGRRHVVFARDTLHDLRSVTKSVVSALVGIALADSAERMLDRPLVDFFPEYADLATAERRAVTLQHALDMTAGFEWNERISYADTTNDEVRMDRRPDPVRFVLERAVVTEPGRTWNYSGGLTQVLGAVVQRATGVRVDEFARIALFEPLGMGATEWVTMANGEPSAASGLRLRPRDLMKFALVYAQGGRWQGRQIVPEAWVAGTVRTIGVRDSIAEFAEGATRERGYARQWWPTRFTLPYGRFDALMAIGNGGQFIAIVPSLALTVVSHAGNYNSPTDFERLLVERILSWAVGTDSTYRFPAPRSVRPLAAGELRTANLAAVELNGYVGTYSYEGKPLRILEQDGGLRAELPWTPGETIDLIPLGEHLFALGVMVDGVPRKLYWPDWRIEFELIDGRAVRLIDRTADGEVYARAERIQ